MRRAVATGRIHVRTFALPGAARNAGVMLHQLFQRRRPLAPKVTANSQTFKLRDWFEETRRRGRRKARECALLVFVLASVHHS